MNRWIVEYAGFLQAVKRTFATKQRAIQWCKQIGRKDLIRTIRRVSA